jgi:hypothetical protein
MERITSGDKAKMPMTERFYSVNGQMMGYESGGVKKDFLTDHLGSITAEIDQNQNRTFETRYSAYGRNNWSTGTGCGFGWVGSSGYRETGLFHMSHYVRARHYSYLTGSWSTVDPLWPREASYGYVMGRAPFQIDRDGTQTGVLEGGACIVIIVVAAAVVCVTASMLLYCNALPRLCPIQPWPPRGFADPKPWPPILPPPIGNPPPGNVKPPPLIEPIPIRPPAPVPLRLPRPVSPPFCETLNCEALNNDMHKRCDPGHSCRSFMAFPPSKDRCAAIKANYATALDCLRRRTEIMDRCYGGGDGGHGMARDQERTIMKKCSEAFKYNGCTW